MDGVGWRVGLEIWEEGTERERGSANAVVGGLLVAFDDCFLLSFDYLGWLCLRVMLIVFDWLLLVIIFLLSFLLSLMIVFESYVDCFLLSFDYLWWLYLRVMLIAFIDYFWWLFLIIIYFDYLYWICIFLWVQNS